MKKAKLVLILIAILLCVGCSDENCVESHIEQSNCVGYSYVKSGNTAIWLPYNYKCKKEVCDVYKEN